MKSLEASDFKSKLQGRRIRGKDKFNFMCHADVECFNNCCRNLKMFLYPYDVLRLKSSLNKTSSEFIDGYVDLILREENYFPDVLLKMKDNEERSCPFVTDVGCAVYADRPYTCRTFPIEQGVLTESIPKTYKLLNFFKPPKFCMGRNEKTEWTMKTWSQNQNVEIHREMTILWSNVKKMFNINPWESDNSPKLKMAFTAAYNIDQFKEFIFKSSFLKRYKIKNKTLKKIKYNELDLLKFGFDWIKLFVWNIKSDAITIKR